jgi:hypothetical protein
MVGDQDGLGFRIGISHGVLSENSQPSSKTVEQAIEKCQI